MTRPLRQPSPLREFWTAYGWSIASTIVLVAVTWLIYFADAASPL